jgi:hypothetical protein
VSNYIEARAKEIRKEVGKGTQHYVFSHLNVKGAHGGSEENLLKKSEVYLPECFLYDEFGYQRPQIIQSHIHSKDTINNINIVGSQIYCTFGEAETEKYFLELSIPTNMGEKENFNYIKTNCVQFNQLELNLTESEWDGATLSSSSEFSDFINNLDSNKRMVIKINPTVYASKCSVNWDYERAKLMENKNWIVKQITPKLIASRKVRSVKQKLGIVPRDALKIFLQTNKPDRVKKKWALAQQYF